MDSRDIEETINNGSNSNEESNRPACAACKHQRKKCRKGCLFLNHFPSNKQQEFMAVHQIFGIANVTKMMKDIVLIRQSETVESIVWEAMIWTNKDHREYGPLGIYKKLAEDCNKLLEENKQLKENIIECQKQNQRLQEENKQLKENLIECQKQHQQFQEENKQFKENVIECQKQHQQFQEENKQFKENVIEYQQMQRLIQSQYQSVLLPDVSNPSFLQGEFSKTANSGNSASMNIPGFPLQTIVPQNTMPPTSRRQLENITNKPNAGPIPLSTSRLNHSRYKPYNHHQSQQFINEGGFVTQHIVLSNQSQENDFDRKEVFVQQNQTVNTPVQNNFTGAFYS